MYETNTRNATMGDLVTMLKDQQARKVDLVTPAATITSEHAMLSVAGSEPVLSDDGVTMMDGQYRPTVVADEGIAQALKIPSAYLKRLRVERPDLYDANVNGWLQGPAGGDADPRSFMLRTFKPAGGEPGIARALLSDRYAIMDNLDVLTAALDGVSQAGVKVDIEGADLTDRRMVVRISAPEVQALAPELLGGYRSPFTGETGADNPTVFAGFVLANSEVGNGAWSITPRMIVQVCRNGMTVTRDAMRAVHLGARQEEGVIRWSEDTQRKELAVVTARTADAVRTFLDVDYMRRAIDAMNEAAGRPVTKVEQVTDVTKALKFTEEHQDGILGLFIQGGQMNRGGIMQAITAYAQTVEDGDTAYDLEAAAVRALTV
jgi:hypothetical protein